MWQKEILIPNPWRVNENFKGVGVSNSKISQGKYTFKLNWDSFSRGVEEGDSNQTQWKNIFWNKIMNEPLYELFLLLKLKKKM